MKNFFKKIWFNLEVGIAIIWDLKWYILGFSIFIFLFVSVGLCLFVGLAEILSNPEQLGKDIGGYLNEFKKGYENANSKDILIE